MLCDYAVQPGDLFSCPRDACTPSAQGRSSPEIQQTSDVTYRIYDYGRLGKDGKPASCDTELAKDAIDYTVLPDYRSHYASEKNSETQLVECPLLHDGRSTTSDAPAEKTFRARFVPGGDVSRRPGRAGGRRGRRNPRSGRAKRCSCPPRPEASASSPKER